MWIDGQAAADVQRGDVVVCVIGAGQGESLEHCVERVRAHSPRDVRIVVADGLRAAAAASSPADVILLDADCIVGEGWLDRLRTVARSDHRVATTSALVESGQVSVRDAVEAAQAVGTSSLRLHPELPSAGGPCIYVTRAALDLVGVEEPGQARPELVVERFAERCLERGLAHLLADDVLVHRWQFEPGSGGGHGWRFAPPLDLEAVARTSPPVARSLGVARRALSPIRVVVDARNLTGPMNGTMVHVLELIAALARTEQTMLTALVPAPMSGEARAVLEAQPGVRLAAAGSDDGIRADLVHRPFQIATPADMPALARLADRLVITHQDLISFHNPSYFRSPTGWHSYRALTRRALAIADHVVFSSAHARDEALSHELVDPVRASVIHCGVDHAVTRSDPVPAQPAHCDAIPDGAELMLCLGTDFRHKNRLFAIDVLKQLRQRHGWDGILVLAGPHVALGSSREEERARLAADRELAVAVLTLGALSEAEKEWLLRRSNLVVYPTVYEGFGLVPFEAADHGVPCLWAPGSSLSDVLPEAEAAIVPWDAAATADRALTLMRERELAERQLVAVRHAATALSWNRTAQLLLEAYREACTRPTAPGSILERSGGLMREGFSEDAIRLVGPNGVLPSDLERPLLALATHPRVGAPVFRAIRAGYRVSARWLRATGH
jgi:glycosyltransferase involved in cell wall biosynthesis